MVRMAKTYFWNNGEKYVGQWKMVIEQVKEFIWRWNKI